MRSLKWFVGSFALAFSLVSASFVMAHDTGPHKGPVVEWGDEEYHLEVVADAKTGDVTVYVYGNHEDLDKAKAKAIETKTLVLTLKTTPAVTVKLEAKPAKEDAKEKSSVFVGKHEVFTKETKYKGTVSGKVGTKPYSGDFEKK